ncbi:single-stranded DNA-binding protein [Pseudonocardia xishanensis]|uniref:Single-stranded DNA-binding protein n=1 Tax=Pseudonocardia xishanensis TaxID=630995 RepID=A0ABP8RX83_9PSEU
MTDILTTVLGRLTNAPTTRILESGREVTSFRIACNHGYFDREAGAWRESSTSYVAVDVWRRNLGRNVVASFAKGDPVIVHGRLYVREYEQEGRPRTAVALVAESVGPDLNTATVAVTRVRRDAEGTIIGDGSPVSEGPRGPGSASVLGEEQHDAALDKVPPVVEVGVGVPVGGA